MSKVIAEKERDVKKTKIKELSHNLNGMKLLGEVVCFNARSDSTHKHKDVVDALTDAGLDPKVAREIMPRFAFTRACKKLTEAAVIDVVAQTEDSVKFQFTKKTMHDDSWKYTEETKLTLDKKTGTITCPKKELQQVAQRLLDEAIEARTTSDITHIVQRLFEKNADLFSLRDQGGVYFVPQEHTTFLLKIEAFLQKIGGSVTRFPVPAGTKHGDKAVQESVAAAFKEIIAQHEAAIDQFSINTRKDTMENAAEKIKVTRIKIEAYANYLQDKSKELLKMVESAKDRLRKQIDNLAVEKENAPEQPGNFLGHSVTAILKWMGKNNWEFEDAKKVLQAKGFQLANSTIRGQLWCGSSGRYGKAAELDAKQVKELEKARKA